MAAVHSPETMPEADPGGLLWRSTCRCGWNSGSCADEFEADLLGLAHNTGEWVDD